MRARPALSLCLVVASAAGAAHAQPADPYAPAPAPAPPAPAPAPTPAPAPAPADPALAEQVAESLVARAQELYDARVFVDAKQLAVEALVRSPRGPAAERARALVRRINEQLGISDATEPAPAPPPAPEPDLTPIGDPAAGRPPAEAPPEGPARASRLTAGVHGGLYAGLLGATIGAFVARDTPAGGAVPAGLAAGLAAGLYAPRLLDRLEWTDAQVRTAGAASVWGGVIGGFFADSLERSGTSAREVLVGASIGATAGAAGGALLARRDALTAGDVALVDTLAGIGAVGGLTVGMLMQPAETEAYSVNAILGAAGGVVVGLIAAPQTSTTPRRMLRVAGLAAAGGAVPFLLYAGIRDGDSTADERITGLLSSAGLLAGAWLGFRLTRKLDLGRDVRPGEPAAPARDDAPVALVGRHSDGRWAPGALAVQPLSRALAPQRGMAVPLVGVAF